MSRATLDELLEFANAVREAGGGNPIDALMPATPVDPEACLIAKNLNFNCEVNHTIDTGWYMYVSDEDIRDKIAEKLKLSVAIIDRGMCPCPSGPRVVRGIILPSEIGQIAEDYDKFADRAKEITEDGENLEIEDKDVEFLALIQESYKETVDIGEFNERGELIL